MTPSLWTPTQTADHWCFHLGLSPRRDCGLNFRVNCRITKLVQHIGDVKVSRTDSAIIPMPLSLTVVVLFLEVV